MSEFFTNANIALVLSGVLGLAVLLFGNKYQAIKQKLFNFFNIGNTLISAISDIIGEIQKALEDDKITKEEMEHIKNELSKLVTIFKNIFN